MKILHVIHSANPSNGGPIEGIKQLASVKTSMGWEIEVASLDSPDAPWVKDFPLKLYPLGPSHLGYGYSPRFVPWLREHRRDYAFVIVNGIWQYNGLGAWRVLRNTDTPYFVFTHGMLDPWFKRNYPLKHVKKWLYWLFAEYRILRDAKAVLFTCMEEKLQARRSFWLYRCNEIVINYGTAGWKGDAESQKRLFFAKFPELQGKRLILFLGRIHEKKGGDLLIEAFHRLLSEMPDPSCHLVMAGPGDTPFGVHLKNMTGSLGIENRVTWTGMLEGDLKWGAFQAAEAFILPSHQENFGIAVAEALSASVPVLISDKVNIWREIDQDHAGLVESDDAEGAFALLKRWMSLPAAERVAMRKNARQCFLNRFEISAAANSVFNACSQFLPASAQMGAAKGESQPSKSV